MHRARLVGIIVVFVSKCNKGILVVTLVLISDRSQTPVWVKWWIPLQAEPDLIISFLLPLTQHHGDPTGF